MPSRLRRVLPLFFYAFAISAFAQTPPQTPDTGISIPSMDPAVRPGDNFYLYANGGFIPPPKLPADPAPIGAFRVPSHLSLKHVPDIHADPAKPHPPTPPDPHHPPPPH